MGELIGSECEEVEGKDIEVEGEASHDEGAFSIDDLEEAEPEGIDGEAEQPYGKSEGGVETYNWQRWEDNKLSMREKRVLMTWIFGKAWERYRVGRLLQLQLQQLQ